MKYMSNKAMSLSINKNKHIKLIYWKKYQQFGKLGNVGMQEFQMLYVTEM